ncbi:hypothetical protein CEW83_20595 [Parazoarcus communis]|uniref:Uncharacterized protein n=1 Tax=Parazoarcus communis TaxID=41977 RepID=A0A2U8GV40_9RHOO|nr:hypothetical protein [Parazoarcus communis]AWI77338.1 hypothetical protein CEW83_20595 [Parazoarcus communis]
MENAAMLMALVAVGLLAFVIIRKKAEGDEPEQELIREQPHRRSFHAVEVRASGKACASSRALKGKRYLSTEAPPIPLPSCTQEACSCVYVHFDDRRATQRRDVYLHGAYEQGERKQERRAQNGRRQSDRLLFGGGH